MPGRHTGHTLNVRLPDSWALLNFGPPVKCCTAKPVMPWQATAAFPLKTLSDTVLPAAGQPLWPARGLVETMTVDHGSSTKTLSPASQQRYSKIAAKCLECRITLVLPSAWKPQALGAVLPTIVVPVTGHTIGVLQVPLASATCSTVLPAFPALPLPDGRALQQCSSTAVTV